MKRFIFILLAALMSSAVCSAAMSNSKVRKETRFLTDKMAYELNLTTGQYNDVYEINYDFIAGIRYLMDDVLRGEEWALNRYYDYLDVRNDDLRWVLSSRQYGRFMQASYFYRPVYVDRGRWSFRVYVTYTNHNHFYFPRPYHYRKYNGAHYRTHNHNNSYYRGRYNHPVYSGTYRIRDHRSYHTGHRTDFGSVRVRPNSAVRPSERTTVRRSRTTGNSNRTRVNSFRDSRRNSESYRGSDKTRSSRGTNVRNTRVKEDKKKSTPRRTRKERKEEKKERKSNVRSSERNSRSSSASPLNSSSSRISAKDRLL